MGGFFDGCIDYEKLKKILSERTDDICKEVLDDIAKDIKNIYEEAITDYYKYATVRYIRHGNDRPGLTKGSNLYNSIYVEATHKNKNHSIFQGLSPENLEDYSGLNIGYNNKIYGPYESDVQKEDVLNYITSGYRFNVGDWKFKVKSKYFGHLTGTLDDINKMLGAEIVEVAENTIAEKLMKIINDEVK